MSDTRTYTSCTATRLAPFDVVEFQMKQYHDDRGYFLETYRERDVRQALSDLTRCSPYFVQDNESYSTKGVLRGLHYQYPCAQGKLVRVACGEIFDVAVNLVASSSYFGQWVSVVLSGQQKNQLWIPPGYAHGFQVLSDVAVVVYKVTDYYNAGAEQCLLWSDPDIGIKWPIADPIMSDKDKLGLRFKHIRNTFIAGLDP